MGVVLFTSGITISKAQTDTHNSRNSLDWNGVYKSLFTSETGAEIASVLYLNKDLTYTMQTAFVNDLNDIDKSSGTFAWNAQGNEIFLKDRVGNTMAFRVGENKLVQIAENGDSLPANTRMVMQKISTESITEKYWKLVEINGDPVMPGSNALEPYIILKEENNRIVGTGGCNTFSGVYELGQMGNIRFSKMISTQKACLDMTIEKSLFKVLETTDNYTLSPDGNTLSLNKARMAPLARFEVVYLR